MAPESEDIIADGIKVTKTSKKINGEELSMSFPENKPFAGMVKST